MGDLRPSFSSHHGVKLIWGAAPLSLPMPSCSPARCGSPTGWSIRCGGLVIIASGLIVAALLYVLVAHTRIGMLVRAGAPPTPRWCRRSASISGACS